MPKFPRRENSWDLNPSPGDTEILGLGESVLEVVGVGFPRGYVLEVCCQSEETWPHPGCCFRDKAGHLLSKITPGPMDYALST